MRLLSGVVLILGLSVIAGAQERPVAIVGVNLIPMTSDRMLSDQTVLFHHGKIRAVGNSSSVKVPKKATTVDGQGRYLIPGLTDLHAHFFGGRKAAPDLLKLFVANGVTTVLNMRGSRGVLLYREKVASGEWLGPTIYSTSPIMGNTSPNPKTFEKGVEVVEQFAADGYDFIKVYNLIPKEGYEGIISAAKRLEIPVVGHAVRSVGITGAIENGQHLAHMEEVIYGYFQEGLDETQILPLARKIKEANISVIATLVTYHNIIRQVQDLDAVLASPWLKYLPQGTTSRWVHGKNNYTNRFTLDDVENRLGPAFEFQQ